MTSGQGREGTAERPPYAPHSQDSAPALQPAFCTHGSPGHAGWRYLWSQRDTCVSGPKRLKAMLLKGQLYLETIVPSVVVLDPNTQPW